MVEDLIDVSLKEVLEPLHQIQLSLSYKSNFEQEIQNMAKNLNHPQLSI